MKKIIAIKERSVFTEQRSGSISLQPDSLVQLQAEVFSGLEAKTPPDMQPKLKSFQENIAKLPPEKKSVILAQLKVQLDLAKKMEGLSPEQRKEAILAYQAEQEKKAIDALKAQNPKLLEQLQGLQSRLQKLSPEQQREFQFVMQNIPPQDQSAMQAELLKPDSNILEIIATAKSKIKTTVAPSAEQPAQTSQSLTPDVIDANLSSQMTQTKNKVVFKFLTGKEANFSNPIGSSVFKNIDTVVSTTAQLGVVGVYGAILGTNLAAGMAIGAAILPTFATPLGIGLGAALIGLAAFCLGYGIVKLIHSIYTMVQTAKSQVQLLEDKTLAKEHKEEYIKLMGDIRDPERPGDLKLLQFANSPSGPYQTRLKEKVRATEVKIKDIAKQQKQLKAQLKKASDLQKIEIMQKQAALAREVSQLKLEIKEFFAEMNTRNQLSKNIAKHIDQIQKDVRSLLRSPKSLKPDRIELLRNLLGSEYVDNHLTKHK